MKNKCIQCEKSYNTKSSYCKKCDFEDAKTELIIVFANSWVCRLCNKILNWLSERLKKAGGVDEK